MEWYQILIVVAGALIVVALAAYAIFLRPEPAGEDEEEEDVAARTRETRIIRIGTGVAGGILAAGLVIAILWTIDAPPFDNGGGNGIPAGNDQTATPTPTAGATQVAQQTPAPRTTVIAAGTSGNKLDGGSTPSYNSGAFRHPKQFVACQRTFDPVKRQVDWILCEPGVLLTATATFTRPEVDAVYNSNCPEGGFWYGSMHHGTILLPDSVGGVRLELKDYGEGTNHLIVIRCRLSDGKRDSDLNITMRVGNFVVGHAIWSPIPAAHPDGSAYVSAEWFGEQLITSHTTGGTNCGSDGCSRVFVNLYDVNSQSWQEFLVTEIKGESSDADRDGIVDYASANWQVVSTNR